MNSFARCILLQICSGLLFGLQLGWGPAVIQFTEQLGNCSAFVTSSSCNTASCIWDPAFAANMSTGNTSNETSCFFSDYKTVSCSHFSWTNESTCESSTECVWHNSNSECKHSAGFSAEQKTLLSSSLLGGGFLGALAAGPIAARTGRLPVLKFMVAVPALVGSVIEALFYQMLQQQASDDDTNAISTSSASFLGLVLVRVLLLGVAVGAACVAAPLYACEVVGPAHRSFVGVFFPICITTGGFICSLLLFAMAIRYDDLEDSKGSGLKFQVFHLVIFIDAALMFFLSFVMLEESPTWLAKRDVADAAVAAASEEREETTLAFLNQSSESMQVSEDVATTTTTKQLDRNRLLHTPRARYNDDYVQSPTSPCSEGTLGDEDDYDEDDDDDDYPSRTKNSNSSNAKTMAPDAPWPLWRVFLMALTLATILRATGSSTVLHFVSSTLLPDMGLDNQVLGDVIIQSLFWVAALGALCVSHSSVKPFDAFVWGTVFVALSCAVIAIAVLPEAGVAEDAMIGLGILGMCVFAISYSCCVAPYFFVLAATSLGFPERQVELGCTLSMVLQFLLNIVADICSPMARKAASSRRDPKEGLAMLFFSFVGFAVVGAAVFSMFAAATARRNIN